MRWITTPKTAHSRKIAKSRGERKHFKVRVRADGRLCPITRATDSGAELERSASKRQTFSGKRDCKNRGDQ